MGKPIPEAEIMRRKALRICKGSTPSAAALCTAVAVILSHQAGIPIELFMRTALEMYAEILRAAPQQES